MNCEGGWPRFYAEARHYMRIHDWLIRPDSTPREAAPSPLRVHELLPTESIRIGPPGAEDKVEISAMAQMLLQASERLSGAEEARVERLHGDYLRGLWQPDPERLAPRLVESMRAPRFSDGGSRVGRDRR